MRRRNIFLTLLLSICCMFIFAGCNDGDKDKVQLVGIDVKTNTLQTEYFVGDAINIQNGKIVLSYSNNNKEEQTITQEMISDFDSSTPGERYLTITFGNQKTYFTYYVSSYTSEEYFNFESIQNKNEVKITGLKGEYPKAIYVPKTLGGKIVTTIDTNAFKNANVDKIVMFDGITTIAPQAFANCYKVDEIVLPNSVTSIGSYAFYNCSSLERVTLPKQIDKIGEYAFYNCKTLVEIIMPETLTELGDGVFYDCSALDEIELPNTLTKIGIMAFAKCESLVNINLKNVETISKWALYCCSSLKNVDISSAKVLADSCLAYTNLQNITLPEGLKTIGNEVFSDCQSLESINFPSTIESLGEKTFEDCENLKTVNFAENTTKLTTIKNRAFSNCSSLENFKIIPSIESIDSCAFQCIENKDNNKFFSIDFSKATGLKEIGSSAFANTKLQKDIVIPKSVTTIRSDTFGNTTGLENLSFEQNSNLTTLEDAFIGSSIKKITLPAKLVSFSKNAFSYSELEEIVFDENSEITAITKEIAYGVDNLRKITFGKNLEQITGSIVSSCPNVNEIAFPENSSLSKISGGAFKNLKITSIAIPSEVTTIEGSAFAGCNDLTSISFKGSKVETIGAFAFSGCSKLTTISLESIGLKTIGESAFNGCYKLSQITLPTNLTSIGKNAFNGCTKLTQITLPNTLTTIGENAFASTGLTKFEIPQSVTNLGGYFVENCSNLVDIIVRTNNIETFPRLVSYRGTLDSIQHIYVPTEKVDTYKAQSSLRNFKDKILSIELIGHNSHTFETTWSYDELTHYHKCTLAVCQEKQDVANHVESAWIIEQEATQTESGTRHKECTICKMEIARESYIQNKTYTEQGNSSENASTLNLSLQTDECIYTQGEDKIQGTWEYLDEESGLILVKMQSNTTGETEKLFVLNDNDCTYTTNFKAEDIFGGDADIYTFMGYTLKVYTKNGKNIADMYYDEENSSPYYCELDKENNTFKIMGMEYVIEGKEIKSNIIKEGNLVYTFEMNEQGRMEFNDNNIVYIIRIDTSTDPSTESIEMSADWELKDNIIIVTSNGNEIMRFALGEDGKTLTQA